MQVSYLGMVKQQHIFVDCLISNISSSLFFTPARIVFHLFFLYSYPHPNGFCFFPTSLITSAFSPVLRTAVAYPMPHCAPLPSHSCLLFSSSPSFLSLFTYLYKDFLSVLPFVRYYAFCCFLSLSILLFCVQGSGFVAYTCVLCQSYSSPPLHQPRCILHTNPSITIPWCLNINPFVGLKRNCQSYLSEILLGAAICNAFNPQKKKPSIKNNPKTLSRFSKMLLCCHLLISLLKNISTTTWQCDWFDMSRSLWREPTRRHRIYSTNISTEKMLPRSIKKKPRTLYNCPSS